MNNNPTKHYLAISWIILLSLFVLSTSGFNKIPVETTTDPQSSNHLSVNKTIFLPLLNNGVEPVIPGTTEVLSQETLQGLVSISDDGVTYTFSKITPELQEVQMGDVIVGDKSPLASDGFLRKVISTIQHNGELTLVTEQATLEETFESALIEYSQDLRPENVSGSMELPGVNLVAAPDGISKPTFYIQIDNVVLFDADGNLSTTNDQIKSSGSINLDPHLSFRARIENFQLKELYSTVNYSLQTGLTIGSNYTISIPITEREIASYPLSPITVMVGPVPVVFRPVLSVKVGIDGSVHSGVSSTVSITSRMTAGLQYTNETWSPIAQFTQDFTSQPPSVSEEIAFKGYVGPQIALMVYGVVGPFQKVDAGLKISADLTANPWLTLKGGFEALAGVELNIFNKVKVSHQEKVIDFWVLLYPTDEMPYVPSNPFPSDGSSGQSLDVDLSWTGGDPDRDPITYDIYFESEDSTPDVLASTGLVTSNYDPGVLIAGTEYYWQVIAKDNHGHTTQGPIWSFMTVPASINNPPNLPTNPSPVDGANDQSLDVVLSWSGGDPDDDAVTYDVYFEAVDSTPDVLISDNQTSTIFNPGTLVYSNTYYWQIIATDEHGASTSGPIWSFTTVAAPSPDLAAKIAAGADFTCAVTSGGGAMCWGNNEKGQLGDGTTDNQPTPVDVSGLASGVTEIAAGVYHTCALTEIGGVKCWGWNYHGQLGDGTTIDRLTPVDVTGLTSGVKAIAAFGLHTCALTESGGVKCWGWNSHGQLGDGTLITRLTPVDVYGLSSGVTTITSGQVHTCAITSVGGVKCWGYNEYGQLGDGTTIDRMMPVDVTGLTTGVKAIAAGNYFSCAVTDSGGVKCWGANDSGQLGDGTTTGRLTPVDVYGLISGMKAISTGRLHTCTLTESGGVKCWGNNDYGQLGDGTTTGRLTAVDVYNLTNGVSAMVAGGWHTCALTESRVIKCWGDNVYGQLGDGTTTGSLTPVNVIGFPTISLNIIDIEYAPPIAIDEYVTLQNGTGVMVDMKDWIIRDENGNLYTFPSFILNDGATVKIWTKVGTDTSNDLYWGMSEPIWDDDGECCLLRDKNDDFIDMICY